MYKKAIITAHDFTPATGNAEVILRLSLELTPSGQRIQLTKRGSISSLAKKFQFVMGKQGQLI